MDTDQLISHARSRFEHAAAKKLLKEKYQAKLIFAHCGGMFESSPEMMAFLSLHGDDQIVIKDLYDNPVQVNAKQLYELMKSRHQEQMNAWLVEFDNLNKNR